jgi:hypothetical protein
MISIKIRRRLKIASLGAMVSILSLVARRVTGKPDFEKRQVVAELQ